MTSLRVGRSFVGDRPILILPLISSRSKGSFGTVPDEGDRPKMQQKKRRLLDSACYDPLVELALEDHVEDDGRDDAEQ